jgi:hypothetical protein
MEGVRLPWGKVERGGTPQELGRLVEGSNKFDGRSSTLSNDREYPDILH